MIEKEICNIIVSGNRRDKFIKWLKHVCPRYKLWHFSDTWMCRNARYHKYYDCVRYSPEKFLEVMDKCLPVYIEFEVSNELLVMLRFGILQKSNMLTCNKLKEFFKRNFKANVAPFPRAGNIDQTNLVLEINTSKLFAHSSISMILVENTMKGL